MHIEAVSGIVLLAAAAVALVWANSPFAQSYHDLWHLDLSIGIGSAVFSKSLHFWINDALMTVFFLVVGMEVRHEIHNGALSSARQAALPAIAALGGVAAPALIYMVLNSHSVALHGWAVPTATDIAFAVGVLALLGRSIPSGVRVMLLALAIIDDIIAVLIIALFYSGGLDMGGLLIAVAGMAGVALLQCIGITSALAYVVPGAIIWFGFLQSGAHPTLAGVVLGLMTPVLPSRMDKHPLAMAEQAVKDCAASMKTTGGDAQALQKPLKELQLAQRAMMPPVNRVSMALHPWVAFGIMPLFALANAGVGIGAFDTGNPVAIQAMLGVAVALVVGKPVGVLLASWLAVRTGLCKLPPGVNWQGVLLVGILAGIGFTMSIFIANLAFTDAVLLEAAKLGVLLASTVAALLGLCYGVVFKRRSRLL